MEKPIILIVGRFQPFHLGHLEIIKKYNDKGYAIKIGIGSSENPLDLNNPFNARERKQMIESALKEAKIKDFNIFLIPDTNDETYISQVKNIVGKFNIIFTGNPWTRDLFLKDSENKNYEIHSFNEKTERINGISATKIRETWIKEENPKDIPHAVFLFLKKINARERLQGLRNKISNARDRI